jgi:hypothetical protein
VWRGALGSEVPRESRKVVTVLFCDVVLAFYEAKGDVTGEAVNANA